MTNNVLGFFVCDSLYAQHNNGKKEIEAADKVIRRLLDQSFSTLARLSGSGYYDVCALTEDRDY